MAAFDDDPHGFVLPRVLEARAETAPDDPLLLFGDETWSAAALNDHANRVARALTEAGLKPGDRCAVMMGNSPVAVAVWIALAKVAAVEVPLNTAYRGDILRHVLKTSGTTMLVTDPPFLEWLGEVLPGCAVELCLVHGPVPDDAFPVPRRSLADLLPDHAGNPAVPLSFSDPACVMFTSGTTGPSKGAVISHRQMIAFGQTFASIVEMRSTDVAYDYLPFFHIAGKFVFMGSLLSGGSTLLRDRFSLSEFWEDVRRHGCTICVGVGGVCNMLHGAAERPDDAHNPLRLIYAVPIPHEIKARFEARFGTVLVEGYGATETNIVTWTSPEGTPHGSCGRVSPWYDVRVVDEYDRELQAGQAGEIVVRGRGPWLLTSGYFGIPEATVAAFRNQWFHTGDRGRFDAEGWLYFIDRMKDVVRRRGENISSYEVEQIVLRHPDVAEAAAVAVPSPLGEDELKLVIVPRQGAQLTELGLLHWCAREMPYFMVPRFIELRTELPRTPTQKIRKVDLRQDGVHAGVWDCERVGWKVTKSGIVEVRSGR